MASVKVVACDSAAGTYRDECGREWAYSVDAMDGTTAVACAPESLCGIFTRRPDYPGVIDVCNDGETYGVNHDGEFAADRGKWVPANAGE